MVRGVPRHTKCGGGAQSSVVADESNQSTLDLRAPRDRVGCPAGRVLDLSAEPATAARLALAPAVASQPGPPFRVPGSPTRSRHRDRAGRILKSEPSTYGIG